MILSQEKKLDMVTEVTLIVGVDIAKNMQFARFCNYQGRELRKALSFANNMEGFTSLCLSIIEQQEKHGLFKVLVGMESTGHYQKPLVNYLKDKGYTVVMVNPYHTKQAKEVRRQ